MTSHIITVAAFYRFHRLQNPAVIREPLLAALKAPGAKGSVLLAEEGVNGTLAAPADNIEAALCWPSLTLCELPELDRKYSSAPRPALHAA